MLATQFIVKSSGFVGIATSSPASLFSVAGTSTFTGQVNLTGTSANIALGSNYLSGDGDDEGIFVDSLGRVGIGTTTPAFQLSVEGNTALASFKRYNSVSSVNAPAFLFTRAGGTQASPTAISDGDVLGKVQFRGYDGTLTDREYGMLAYKTIDTSTRVGRYGFYDYDLNTERMSILTSGNVGIGTTTPSSQLTTTGTVRFANFGAGTLQTDASGNLSVSSDERLKDIQGAYTAGLSEVLGLEPILYKWNKISGLETGSVYAGFSAQNVRDFLPDAVGEDKRGYLTLSDRGILAAVVNAVKEMWTTVTDIKSDIEELKAENVEIKKQNDELKARLDAIDEHSQNNNATPSPQPESSPSESLQDVAPTTGPDEPNVDESVSDTLSSPETENPSQE